MTGEEALEKIVDVMINQPIEGLLYDLNLLPEQCRNDQMNIQRIVVEKQAVKIKESKKKEEWLLGQYIRCLVEAKASDLSDKDALDIAKEWVLKGMCEALKEG